jgi:phosphatidyl-myo-inositol dimannoside synthase
MPARYPKNETGGEGFPVVYLEAAAWALPVVAGDVGGPREAVVNGETGLLVDPEDSKAVKDALLKLLTDRSWATTLGENGRNRVEREFTWPAVSTQLEAALLRAAARG